MFAAGGTGGHIYPALALAHSLQERNPDCDIHFVGTSRGLENKILARENFPLHHIAIGQLNRNVGVVKRLITVLKLPLSFLQSLYLILRLRSEVVIGVGGYVSGPVLLMAKLLEFGEPAMARAFSEGSIS